LLLLGADDSRPGQDFHRITSAFRHTADHIFVADRGSSEVRLFDGRGALQRRIGGRGGGPEEFAALMGVWPYASDSVYTFDPVAQRISIWTVSGVFGRSLRLPTQFGPRILMARHADVPGFVVVVAAAPRTEMAEPGESAMDSVDIVVLDETGDALARLRVQHQAIHTTVPPDGRAQMHPLPFDPVGLVATGRRRIYYGWPDEWTVFRFDHQGGVVDTLRFDLPTRPLTADIIDRWVEQRLASVSALQRPATRRYFESLPFPLYLPTFDRMLEDDLGYLWLREFRVPEASAVRWYVVDSNGEIVAYAEIDGSLEPTHVGPDFIVGVSRDELDRERVAVVSLERAR
jgi:hypothetical protein